VTKVEGAENASTERGGYSEETIVQGRTPTSNLRRGYSLPG